MLCGNNIVNVVIFGQKWMESSEILFFGRYLENDSYRWLLNIVRFIGHLRALNKWLSFISFGYFHLYCSNLSRGKSSYITRVRFDSLSRSFWAFLARSVLSNLSLLKSCHAFLQSFPQCEF